MGGGIRKQSPARVLGGCLWEPWEEHQVFLKAGFGG